MTAEHLPGLEPRDGTTTPTRRARRWALIHLGLDGGFDHYIYEPVGGGLIDLIFVDEDGTKKLIATGVDLLDAVAVFAQHAQLREEGLL